MSTQLQRVGRGSDSSKRFTKRNAGVVAAVALAASIILLVASSAGAQTRNVGATEQANVQRTSLSAADLPAPAAIDAPQPQLVAEAVVPEATALSGGVPQDQPGGYEVAPLHTKYILPNQRAQPLKARDKMLIGLQDVYSPLNFGGIVLAAGYEQLRNGQPNYGTDRGAFGERLGAAGIRDSAQGVITDAIFAPLLHEDPRYYVEGSGYGVLHRALYAATRPLITRTDSGRQTINGALLLGYASTSLLNNAYYPEANRNARDNAEAFAGSIGGSALGFVLTEFTSSLWGKFHLGQKH